MTYTIGEIAKNLKVAPSAIRYYDKEGLLPFVDRSKGGIRTFKDEDFQWLTIIDCLKKAGLPIKDIKTFIDWCMEGDSTIDPRLELINARREIVMAQIKEMEHTLQVLNYKQWYYETAKKAGTCHIHDTMPESEVPEEFRELRKE